MRMCLVPDVAGGLLALCFGGRANAQDADQVKGTLKLGGTTYKLTTAVAYVLPKGKQTVVILREKALDTTKLKQSLAKKGTDEDFSPFDSHFVKLRFNDKGTLVQSFVYADGANIIDQDDGNIKATAAINDGVVKGTARMVKPGEFFKKTYQYDVAFEVPFIQGAAAAPDPTPAVPKPTPKAAPPAVAAGEPAVVTEKGLRFEGRLSDDSPEVLDKPARVHEVKLSPGKTYQIDLESTEFDAYLHVLDSNGKSLAHDDDSGGNRNARLRFKAPREGTYQLVATRIGSRQGNYVLKIRVLSAQQEK